MQVDSTSSQIESDAAGDDHRTGERRRAEVRRQEDRRFIEKLLPPRVAAKKADPAQARKQPVREAPSPRAPMPIPIAKTPMRSTGAALRAQILGLMLQQEQVREEIAQKADGQSQVQAAARTAQSAPRPKGMDPEQDKGAQPQADAAAPIATPGPNQPAPAATRAPMQLPPAVIQELTQFALLTDVGGAPEFRFGLNRQLLGGAVMKVQLLQRKALRVVVTTRDRTLFGPTELHRLVSDLVSQGVPIVESELQDAAG